ncbi:MAG: histidinol-phosphate transaminase, partial [Gammaproteobacteria bacterium]|nr:histidinol-phosphate transaminase [Gammaproteobacteria bacterium]
MALVRYPDAGAQALRRALARCHCIDPNSIVFGAGSESLITLIARTFAGP